VPERCKSRQRFREGGFFYGFPRRLAATFFSLWRRGKPLRQADGGWRPARLCFLEEPIDFVGFSTILRSALQ
jgi:hypothetical protein